jgi:hypothetical protein
LPNGAVGDCFQFASGRTTHDQDPGSGGDARLEGQSDECDDETTVTFNGRLEEPRRGVGVSYQFIYESSAGKIQLGCHKKPLPLASVV